MSGMMRFKSEKDFKEMLAKSHLKVVGDTAVKVRQEPAKPSRITVAESGESEIEALLAQQIANTPLPIPERNYHYLRGSRHELDFAWPKLMMGVEVQGMAHRIKNKFKNDIKKRAQGLLQGWKVLEVGGDEIRDGTAIQWLHELYTQVSEGGQCQS